MTTYRIVKFQPLTKEMVECGIQVEKEVLMSGLQGEDENFKFRPTFELKLIREQRKTYYNEHCTEVENWVFNVCSHNSDGGDILFCYHIEEETPDTIREQQFKLAKKNCKSCEGSGQILHNGSWYGCAHGLSLEERTFNGKIH